ncbi:MULTISPECIES: hypothetical protein [unclassified Lysobacter]|uniref:hypothetical protein n=1 Tax=unclassified Lysobacter TaxID=2635362 RepID=UPI001BE58903|nr:MULTISPECIES: hypothetical protein [unclassified Lysobacter]MBT2746597.1 hypothetical protein [Lysobacter sp. ISL-42]MBT2753408.1 hypothetical protein [Lysobacter sp. ISL-50]MBT2775518.1 hypothetical protein [Lysobacter sp. ISL-54]MBT2782946.1 hypothetical protein [Lysobacter sp. ISL-52]
MRPLWRTPRIQRDYAIKRARRIAVAIRFARCSQKTDGAHRKHSIAAVVVAMSGLAVGYPGRAAAEHPDSGKSRAGQFSGTGGEDTARFTLEFKRTRPTPVTTAPDARRRAAKRRPASRDSRRFTTANSFMYQNKHPALTKHAIYRTKNTQ